MRILSIFVTLLGVLLLIPYAIHRIGLRYATAQEINLDYNVVGIQFMGWLGIVTLIMGVALIAAYGGKKK